jgi:Glyoxalase-like domain
LQAAPGIENHDAMELTCVTVDCRDPAAVASFWNDALGWGGVVTSDEGIAVTGPPSGGAFLEFVPVPEAKRVKNRVHLGCSAGRLDELDAEIARLQALGATIAWEEEFAPEIAASYRNVVLRDVEGNEFCLSGGTMPS